MFRNGVLKVGASRNDFDGLTFSFIEFAENGRATKIFIEDEGWVSLEENVGLTFHAYSGFTVGPREAQDFFDRLWQIGMRPTEHYVEQGAVPAMKQHIKDLQGIIGTLIQMNTNLHAKYGAPQTSFTPNIKAGKIVEASGSVSKAGGALGLTTD